MKIIYYGKDKQPVKEFIDKLPLKDRAVMIEKYTMVLLHGYKKKSQKAPSREIEIARNRMTEVLKNETIYIR